MEIQGEQGALRVRLPLVSGEPFPGVEGIALLTPTVALGGVFGAHLGLFGWLDPYVLGGSPIVALLLPLGWVVARGRERSLVLELGAVLDLLLGGRTVRVPAASPVGLAGDRIQIAGLDVHLVRLDEAELATLRTMLVAAGHPTHAVSERRLLQPPAGNG